jgi:hypothetical protein
LRHDVIGQYPQAPGVKSQNLRDTPDTKDSFTETTKTLWSPRELDKREAIVNRSELLRVEKYLRRKFGNSAITLKEQKDGSCEVLLDDEFIGVLFRDEEDGEVSYAFNMAILDIDLDDDTGISVPR